MLKTKSNSFGKRSFHCPNCKKEDGYYMNTPAFCLDCEAIHTFDIETLEERQSSRVKYHFYYGVIDDDD